MDNKVYYDIALYEVAYFYLKKKRFELTTGNLFWMMEKILRRAEKSGNRFKKAEPKFKFKDNHCELSEDFISSSMT